MNSPKPKSRKVAWVVLGVVLVALVEYAGWRRPAEVAAWVGLGASGAALALSLPNAAAGAVAFGVVTVWAVWRHVVPPAWLSMVGSSAMALEIKAGCDRCNANLLSDKTAYICSYECTFCTECAASLEQRCPNCGGELVHRPTRSATD